MPRSATSSRRSKPEVVSFHFGLPEPSSGGRVKAAGSVVLSSATTAAEARWLEARGVDAIIAQGNEAGGHRGMFLTDDLATQVGTFALVPQIVDAVKVPVIAAGGITDARGIAAAFALGAAGVQIGTAYLWSPGSEDFGAASRGAQVGARRRHGGDQSDDRPSGARHHQPGDARDRADLGRGARISARGGALAPLRAKAEAQGSGDFSPMWAGQAASLGRALPAGELTEDARRRGAGAAARARASPRRSA